MAEMTQVHQKLDRQRGSDSSRARLRANRAEVAGERIAPLVGMPDPALDGQPTFELALQERVTQWEESIPNSDVSKLRYMAELDGGSTFSHVLLP
jgi:hypothetical protein